MLTLMVFNINYYVSFYMQCINKQKKYCILISIVKNSGDTSTFSHRPSTVLPTSPTVLPSSSHRPPTVLSPSSHSPPTVRPVIPPFYPPLFKVLPPYSHGPPIVLPMSFHRSPTLILPSSHRPLKVIPLSSHRPLTVLPPSSYHPPTDLSRSFHCLHCPPTVLPTHLIYTTRRILKAQIVYQPGVIFHTHSQVFCPQLLRTLVTTCYVGFVHSER